MTNIRQHAALAVVESMIVGAGNHIDAETLQVFEQLRKRRHEGSRGNPRGPLVPGVNRAFEIGESGVGAAENLSELEKLFFPKGSQFARQHGVAGQRDRKISSFGFVSHVFSPCYLRPITLR